MTRRILITSALPYINGVKHLGNLAGSQLPAVVAAPGPDGSGGVQRQGVAKAGGNGFDTTDVVGGGDEGAGGGRAVAQLA